MEMTTDEILDEIKNIKEIDKSLSDDLSETLRLADMVKFAKERPLPLENDNSLSKLVDFVKGTYKKAIEAVESNNIETSQLYKTEEIKLLEEKKLGDVE